jgi:uridylate kinase
MSSSNIEAIYSPLSVQDLEKEVAIVTGGGNLIRHASPVIHQWPWTNGIPLHHGQMAQFLRGHLGEDATLDDTKKLVLVRCNDNM